MRAALTKRRLVWLAALAALAVAVAAAASEPSREALGGAGEEAREALALPEAKEGGTRKVALGERVSLDNIGPLVIQTDGTAKRIANWDKLSPQERESTLRVIGKRNRERVAQLKKEGKAGVEGPDGHLAFSNTEL